MKSAFTVSVTDLLAGLEGRGVHLWYEGPQLRFRAPQGALGAEQRAELAARRDEVLAALRARDAAQTTFAPLSYGQRSLWLVQQQNPASVAYNVAFALSIRSPLPPQRLREALQALADRHAILRTTYVPVDGQPQQRIAGEAAAPLEVLERPGLDDAALHALLAADYARAFDLVNGPVWRCTLVTRAPEDHAFLLCAHHIATDGWSLLVMLDELRQWLSGLAAGRAPVLPLPGHAYADYVTWQREMLAGPEGQALGRYWEDKLRPPRAEVELPGDRPRPPHKSFRGASLEFRLAASLTARLQQFAKAEGTTLFVLMLAAFKLLLHRWSGLEDIVVGTPTLGRAKGQFDRTLGDFMNPVPLRTQVLPAMDFRSLLGSVRQTLVEALDHQDFPFARIVERLQPVRDPSRSPLFETAFVLQRFDAFGDLSALLNAAPEDAWRDFGGLQVRPYALAQQDGQFDLSLGLVDTGASLSGAFKYNTDLFEGETIERLLGHYERLLEALLERPGVPIDRLAMLGDEERRQLLLGWNSTAADYAREQTVHGLFEAQVQRTPEAPALQFEGEELSYRELNTRANRLAHHLRSLGVGRGALVGVWLERSVEMVVAVLGALKAGAAYVPLDPAFPQERIDYMMADAALALVLTQQRLAATLGEGAPQTVCLEADAALLARAPAHDPAPLALAGDLAYVIYTSGSTGRPKGVMIEHRAAVNFLVSMQHEPGIGAGDRFVSVTTLSFDIAGLELHGPLTCGGTVVLAARATALDGQALAALLDDAQATLLQATPATWRLLLDRGWRGRAGLKMLCGGEALPRDLAERLLALPGELWNMYGPTETTIWSTLWRVTDAGRTIPIGRPIANTQCYVLDPANQPAPIGVGGELCIGGDGLARGYLGREELTAEKFVTLDLPEVGLTRVYRTGDVVRWLASGALEYVGRRDHQVKLRGFRIELGEIEAVLSSHPGVKDNVVHVREDTPGDQRLVAYVVTTDGAPLDAEAARTTLRVRLPEYMVPNLFVTLPALPLTPNGKVDRKALPAPAATTQIDDDAASMTPLQSRVAALWCEVLKVEHVGLKQNFFDLGGHSLLATRVLARIEADLGVKLTLRDVFEAPTLYALARRAALATTVAEEREEIEF